MRYIISICSLIILLLGGCKRSKLCKEDLPPNTFFFIVKQNGQTLPNNFNLRLHYLKDGEKIYRPSPTSDDTVFLYPASRYSGNLNQSKVWASGYLYYASRWYLEFPNGDTDTLDIATTELSSCEEAQKNRCYCYKPFTSVVFNGKEAPEYTEEKTADGKPIFLFQK
jgi:hypothetical protein